MAIGSSPVANERFGNVSSGTLATTPSAGNHVIFALAGTTGIPSGGGLSSMTIGGIAATKFVRYSVNRSIEYWIAAMSGSPTNSWSANTSIGAGYFIEWSGLSGSQDGAAAGGNSNNSTNPATTSITPANGTDVLMLASASRVNTPSSGPTNGFTNVSSAVGQTSPVAYLVPGAASGSYATDWTYAAASDWDTYIITLTAAGGGATAGRLVGGTLAGGLLVGGLLAGN